MVLDDTVLLLVLIPEQLCTGNLTTTHKPSIFCKVTKHVRLTCALRRKFNHIQSRLNENQKTGKELHLLSYAFKSIRIVLHRRKHNVNPLLGREVLASVCQIVYIYGRIWLEWLVVNHLHMILFAVRIWHETNLDDTPCLAINKLSFMLLANVIRNLSLIEFDTHIRNREPLHILDKVNIDDKPAKQCQVLSVIKSFLHL